MTSRPRQPDELDSLWKEALDHFLEWFMEFCFPGVHAGIDWNRGYQSRDKELKQIVHETEVGKRLADKHYEVWAQDGMEASLLIHFEALTEKSACVTQTAADPGPPRRCWLLAFHQLWHGCCDFSTSLN